MDTKGMRLRPGMCSVVDASHQVDAALHELSSEQLPAKCNQAVMPKCTFLCLMYFTAASKAGP